MPRRLLERRTVVLLLVLLLIASGTPQVLAQESATQALTNRALAAAVRARQADANPTIQRVGLAPDLNELSLVNSGPTPSGANPLYPPNHTFDADEQPVGTPPANHDFSAPGYAVGVPPSNYDLQAAAESVGTPPTNHDFETGTLTGWTASATTTIDTHATYGSFANIATGTLTSSAFTVDPTAQILLIDIGRLATSGFNAYTITGLSGATYSTTTQLANASCMNCAGWSTVALDISSYRGQSIKLRIERSQGQIGVDAPRMQLLFPDYTTSGLVTRVTETDGNVFARLDKDGVLISAPFVVDSATQFVSVKAINQHQFGGQFWIYILSGPTFATETRVHINTNAPSTWTRINMNASQWLGQTVKLKITRQAYAIGVDDIGLQTVDIPEWTVAGDAWIEANGPSGTFVSTNGNLTSAPFTIPAGTQHLTLDYKSANNSTFFVEVLRGATFSIVTDLHSGIAINGDATTWKTLRVSVAPYAGETVKLRIRQYWGRGQYDNVGLMHTILPGWQLTTTQAVAAGEDSHGSWVQAFDRSAAYLRSETISTGIIDRPNKGDRRYYAISYDIGYRSGELVRVRWYATAGPGAGNNWVVFDDASNTPTGYKTRYFYLADFMGTDGYFVVQLPDKGRVYSIADSIARQHLMEPFSSKVGSHIDTSTGSFGFQKQDIATMGATPLVLTRYYAAHSAQYGALGYRWSHTFDIRLVINSDGDAGIVFGSGAEAFFDWNSVSATFHAADARIHDTLTKNVDGSFTFTTKAGTRYEFTPAGRLTAIVDLNANAITLSYDSAGRLALVSDPDGRNLAFAYDAHERLVSVTDPMNNVVEYAYDTNGDLVTVTDPAGGVWSYSYDRHRLISAMNPHAEVIFTNILDTYNRVISQTDGAGNPMTISYDTPAKGVTSATDREGNTARFYYDRYGRTTTMIDPLNRQITRFYDATGNLERIIDPAFNEWEFGYNSAGDLIQTTDPLGNPVAIDYNAMHLPTTVTDGRGYTTTYTYDARGNVTSITDALNQTTTVTYDAAGRVLTVTNPLNETATYSYDAQGNPTSISDPLGNTWQATYDQAGRILTSTDPRNFTTTYEYDPLGRLTLVRDPLGGETRAVFDIWGFVLLYQDPLGRQTTWTYDEKGRVIAKTDAAHKATTYTWNGNDNLIAVTDALGHTTSYTYDASGRLTSVTDTSGGVVSYAYDATGNVIAETDPLGRSATYAYDAAGRMTSQVLSNGAVLTYTYDANGNLLTETNPLNQTTSYTYDPLNRLTSVTNPLNQTTSYAYDALGRMIEEHDALGQITAHDYDAAGRLIAVTDPLSAVTTFGYDAAGNQTTITDPLGHTTTRTYDALNRLTSLTNALNQTTVFAYDAAGQRSSVTSPSGATNTYAHDARGLLTAIADPLGHTLQYGYDDIGRRTSMTDQRGYTTTYTYDAQLRQTTITDALNGQLRFTFDAAGQVESLTNPRGKTTSYTYTNLGQLASQTDPLNRVTTYAYDALGRLTTMTDPRTLTTGYAYDAAGNLTTVSFSGGTVSYSYDALQRRTSMTDATGVTSWGYDAASRVTNVSAPAGVVSYSYDAASRRTSMTYPGNRTVTYTYDDANRLTALSDWQSQTYSFTYNADGQRTTITRPNGIGTTYGYDTAGRLTSLVHGGAGLGSNLSFSYTLDPAGNRTAVTGTRGTETYTLDALNRLTEVVYPNADTVLYTYDANGNRLTEVVNNVTTATYVYDDADQLTSDGTTSYAYDLAGNLVSAGSDAFAWDWKNRLDSATINGTTSSYTYDGDDVRVSQTVGGATTTYVWDRESGLPLLLDDGAQSYVYAGDLHGQVASNGTSVYPLADALGSVRALTDSAGVPIMTADYAVFGDVRGTTGTPSSFGFTGEQQDAATGLTFLRARYYSPLQGRFLSADTVQPNAPGSQGYNRYAYVANNPTTWTDPSGHIFAPALPFASALPFVIVLIAILYIMAMCLERLLPACQGSSPGGFSLPSFKSPSVAPPTDYPGKAVPPGWDWQSWPPLEVPSLPVPWNPPLPEPGTPGEGPGQNPGSRPGELPYPDPDWFSRPGANPTPNPTPQPIPPAQPAPTPGAIPEPLPTQPPSGTQPSPTPPPDARPRMLVQLQEGRSGRTIHHDSIPLHAQGGTVTTVHATGALQQLRMHPAIPRGEQRRADDALKRATRWVQARPPDGVSTQGYSKSFYFNPKDPQNSWRFDVVNLIGTNLTR